MLLGWVGVRLCLAWLTKLLGVQQCQTGRTTVDVAAGNLLQLLFLDITAPDFDFSSTVDESEN